MAQRLTRTVIVNTDTNEKIGVMYNPDEFSLDEGANFAEVGIPGRQSSPLQYVRGRARTLSMELFFDTYESGEDVRQHSGRVVALLEPNPRTGAPPVLVFTMGTFAFKCVLAEVGQRYTMFLPSGTPVRATLSVRFQEFTEIAFEVERGLFIGPPTLHNIASGQQLSQLAGAYLGDAARWREIANVNGVDNPLSLLPGASLVIPGGGS
jgi:hypothetical protein